MRWNPIRQRALPSAAALAVLALVACAPSSDQEYARTLVAFGTLVDIQIYGAEPKRAQAALDAVEDEFEYMHRTWHAWQPSALGRVNTLLATTEWFSVAPSIRPLIIRATALSRASDGLFNPAIGNLVDLWGFHQDGPPSGPPPTPQEVAAAVAQRPSMTDLELDGIRLRSRNPGVSLDFGAFAKGYGIDRTIELLRQFGIRNAIINAGGDLRAIGRHGERRWRIGIRKPRGTGILASVAIDDGESVFTSGDYERYFEHEGTRYHHILDPRTGYPATGVTSVTVIHDQADAADAAATALFVAGLEGWQKVARTMGIRYVMLVDTSGKVYMNPAMAERIQIEADVDVTVTEPL